MNTGDEAFTNMYGEGGGGLGGENGMNFLTKKDEPTNVSVGGGGDNSSRP